MTRCRHGRGGGTDQTMSPRHRQTITAICLLEIALRALMGRYRRGDHRDGAGDLQKVEDEDRELEDDEEDVDEASVDARENLKTEEREGVARSLGDFSWTGIPSWDRPKTLERAASRNPIADRMKGAGNDRLQQANKQNDAKGADVAKAKGQVRCRLMICTLDTVKRQ